MVKLSEGTIRKRLGDFKDTPSSRLTIDEFLKVDLEQEHDPPSYIEAKRRAKVSKWWSTERWERRASLGDFVDLNKKVLYECNSHLQTLKDKIGLKM